MAKYTMLIRAREDAATVVYRFGPDEEHLGLMEFDKRTKDYRELESHPVADAVSHLEQAYGKCYKFCQTTGVYPDTTQYAA